MGLDDARNAAKTGWRLLVQLLGGVDATAAACGASRSLVSDYGNRNSDRFPPVHVVLAAERIAGVQHVTAAMARAGGCELHPVEVVADAALSEEMARVGASMSTLFADWATAVTHGTPTAADRDALARDIEGAVHVLGLARAAVLGLVPAPLPCPPEPEPSACRSMPPRTRRAR